ncbi:MAG: helix-turn-helix transcriptional regulator [Clostridia bacterium]|nr:helix-turn-helix transcriptional regulator [Clostridia bacterium]
MDDKLNLIKQLVDITTGMSISVVNLTKEEIEKFLNSEINQISIKMLFDGHKQTTKPNMQEKCIYEVRCILDICFMAYYNKGNKRLFLCGPFLTRPSERQATSFEPYGSLVKTVQRLPVISINEAYRIMTVLVENLVGKVNPSYKIIDLRESSEKISETAVAEGDAEILQMKQIEDRYERSAALTEAVKEGNFSLAIKFLSELHSDKNITTRNANPLRNRQNYCIILNTQLRYALESCGIHPYRLDRFSEETAIKIEKIKSIEEVDRFIFDTIRRYCELATEHIYPNLKPLVHLTVAYIKNYLTDNISVKTTAKELGVNANYLSTMFHKEMGMTFIDFLNKERVRQAAALMENTDLQIQEIATSVGYNNGSYFAKQFKKYYDLSPIEYKKHLRI